MKSLSEMEKSQIRVAAMMLNHCVRFRLMPEAASSLNEDDALDAVRCFLDQLGDRVSAAAAAKKHSAAPKGEAAPRTLKKVRGLFLPNEQ